MNDTGNPESCGRCEWCGGTLYIGFSHACQTGRATATESPRPTEPNPIYGVRECRGHWHVTCCGEDIAVKGDLDSDKFSTREKAQAEADVLNAGGETRYVINRGAVSGPAAQGPRLPEDAAECFPISSLITQEMFAREWSFTEVARRMGGDLAVNLCTLEFIMAQRDFDDDTVDGILLGSETAEALATAFGTSAEMWLRIDDSYRRWRKTHCVARRAAPPRDDELLQLAWQAFCNWASKGVDETPDMNALAQAVRDRGFPTDVRRAALGTDPR